VVARGKRGRALLARLARSGSPRARARARRLLLHLERARAARRLCGYALCPEVQLERGLFLLARFGYPNLDARPYLAALDALGAELSRRTEHLPPTLERALCLPRYLGDELGFTGDGESYDHPDHVFLHRVLETKRGLPLTLAALYQAVARRAGIRAHLVGLPGHVVLRLSGEDRRALIDPFRGGVELSERDCLAYLAGRGLTFQPRWFQDAGDAAMLERQIRNLIASYRRRGLLREIELLGRVQTALQARRGGALEVAP
jgi:regulator of sirC expression with transglutaminase-like and TPR domain